MPLSRRHLAALLGAAPLAAQAHRPDRPVQLIVPFSAGGAADIAARLFAQHAPTHMGAARQLILVENRPGASGGIGTHFVARAQPDGHTLLLARVGSSAILPASDARTPYDVDDFTWLGMLDENPFVIAVRSDARWENLAALLATLRDGQQRLRFATSGPATLLDLGIRHMLVSGGLPIDAAEALTLRGGGEATQALLAGEADFLGNNLSDLMEPLRAGQLRALAVSGAERLPGLPDIPSTAEAGLPEMAAVSGWNALAGPGRMEEGMRRFWEEVVARVGADPAWLTATRANGSRPRPSAGAAARAHVLAQIAFYQDLARRLSLG